MKKLLQILSILIAASLTGCASINSVSLTPLPTQRGNIVTASVSKTVFLGFNFDNDYVDPLVTELKQKCPGGFVSGILTKDEVIAYVLVFTRHITATGYCSTAVAKATRPAKRSTASEGTNPDSPTGD